MIEENIAFNTAGHCFITEDGMETGNVFQRNLAAKTTEPDEIIEDYGPNGEETVRKPSVGAIVRLGDVSLTATIRTTSQHHSGLPRRETLI